MSGLDSLVHSVQAKSKRMKASTLTSWKKMKSKSQSFGKYKEFLFSNTFFFMVILCRFGYFPTFKLPDPHAPALDCPQLDGLLPLVYTGQPKFCYRISTADLVIQKNLNISLTPSPRDI